MQMYFVMLTDLARSIERVQQSVRRLYKFVLSS